jgi:hypothetical protein
MMKRLNSLVMRRIDMKKILFIVAVGLLIGTAGLYADHPGGLGIGPVFGGGSGSVGGGLFYPGLNLKLSDVPVFWGFNAYIGSYGFGMGVTGDYYLIDSDLVTSGSFDLDWYFGLGGFAHLFFGNDFYMGLGLRVPIGLSWHITKQFELYLAAIPGIGLSIPIGLYWAGSGELGLRIWLLAFPAYNGVISITRCSCCS